ncbi:MAG TPA: pyrroloquinoline quinone-dependent dehydrogenase [Bryobacteraceae bacterium]|nr:pyrroloquinoline quinone-dependent dehydrogenase [Bryobacteraceae bacterium]
MNRTQFFQCASILSLTMTQVCHAQNDWPVFGHDAGAQKYSPLTQITPRNVGKLRLAWKYSTAEAVTPPPNTPSAGGAGPGTARGRISEISPLVVGNVMYVTSPYNFAAALEPETGKEIWKWEYKDYGPASLRGLTHWAGDRQSPATIFFGTEGGYLIALNAKTGKPVPGFADEGILNLRKGMTEKFPNLRYGLSSPPSIYKNLVIAGSHLQESPALGPSGDVRAWDVHTGKLVWTFHTIPQPGEPNFDTWTGDSWKNRSGSNVWGTMTVDLERGIIYLPLGCTTKDYDGTDRPGLNLYGTTLVALDAATGKVKWYFQTTHHDIWDYDLNAPPALIDITVNGKKIPAVAEISKEGLLFVFDRTTGKPVYGIEERPVPQDGFAEGEQPWPTQPFPVKPPPLSRNSFQPDEIAKITPQHQKYCEEKLEADGGAHYGGPYTSFGEKAATVIFPSTLGGGLWAGIAYDPKLGYMFVNTQELGDFGQHGGGPRFWDAEKHWPCQQPPWGLLTAVDSRTGDIAWKVPLGSYPELEQLGIHHAGTPNIGGVTATASGLLFVSGTLDNKMYAFDSKTGQELWSTALPAAGHAIPVTYLGKDGKQYVAVMVSGGGYLGDTVIPATLMVYALP